MKKFPHQQFIEDNGIAIDTLPKMLQKRFKGFEELQEDLEHTTEHDREQLLDKLDLLSMELEEDLEEQFEHQLENNDEEEEPEVKEEIALPDETIEENNASITATAEPEIADEVKSVNDEDEDILSQLFSKKQLKVSPAQLIDKGFKKKLDNKLIAVGKYALYRGKYDTCYTLLLKEK
jgi:hypothetical protein